jgi:hypothetical protein
MGLRADLDTLENKKMSFPGLGAELTVNPRPVDLQCAFCCTSPFRRLCLWQQKVAGSGHTTSELAPFIFTVVTQSTFGVCCQNKPFICSEVPNAALRFVPAQYVAPWEGGSLKALSVDGNIILTDVLLRDSVLD